jgi:hypothetical protein
VLEREVQETEIFQKEICNGTSEMKEIRRTYNFPNFAELWIHNSEFHESYGMKLNSQL